MGDHKRKISKPNSGALPKIPNHNFASRACVYTAQLRKQGLRAHKLAFWEIPNPRMLKKTFM